MATKLIKNTLIVIGFIVINIANIYAYNLCGEDIWMGWSNNQYGSMSYGAVADYSIDDERLQVKGYGRYQFNYKTNLVDFLTFLDEDYFKRYIEFGKGSDKLNDFDYGLQRAFTDYYNDNKDKMINKQDEYFYKNYYLVIKNKLNDKGLNLDDYSEYIKGAVFSYAMYNINNNEITQFLNEQICNKIISFKSEDEKEFISNIYNYLIDVNDDNKKIKERFEQEKVACVEKFNDEFNSKIGEMLNLGGRSNSFTNIRNLNNEKPKIFNNFLVNGKFYTQNNLDWYDSVRNSVDYKKEFGIDSGVLDFGISTSKGFNIDGYLDLVGDEVAFKKPNNDYDVIYIPQNYNETDHNYSNIKFGVNNIAQGGGSLACISMVINKFLNYSGDDLILPNHLVDKIKEKHNDNYNYYYDEEKMGQKNEIINDLCSYYGLSSNIIGGNSITSALANSSLIIARVQESEFTRYGNFVLIVGSEVIDGNQMFCVYDPNLYHANYLYKLYDVNYLKNDCKGIFFEIRK